MGSILAETGKTVFGDPDYRLTGEGRKVRRPITAEGRHLLGDYGYTWPDESMPVPIAINYIPTVLSAADTRPICWDLGKMMPAKFQNAPVLMDYLAAVSRMVNVMAGKTDFLPPLADVNECPREYLGNLASLIGYKLKNLESENTEDFRRQIKMAVEMYRIKGTYNILDLAFYTLGFDILIYDLWTTDYATFVRADAHSHGDPPMANGYKSPHFHVLINVDKPAYYAGVLKLFDAGLWPYMSEILEDFTPINTVPHFYLSLYCKTWENYEAYLIDSSKVWTCISNNWDPSIYYMDAGHRMDDSLVMDWSYDAMLADIDTFKVGNGNKGNIPNSGIAALDNVIYTGAIDSYKVQGNRVRFKMRIPVTEDLASISELALHHTLGDLMVVAFFPDLDKPLDTILEITVDIMKI